MHLLIIRHADAGDAEEFAKSRQPDNKRPLSDKGREQMDAASRALCLLVPKINLLAASPYVRALQTAEIVLTRYPNAAREITDTLVPEAHPEKFTQWLKFQGSREIVAAVGHEPHLSTLATWLTAGVDSSRIELKKGGACLVSFGQLPAKGTGTLEWLLTGKQLAKLK
jgi:phosphohistidine phosphatase